MRAGGRWPLRAPHRHRTRSRRPPWINQWNAEPKPFVWTKTADEFIDTLAAYCRRINDSGH
jgi:hypothetical protein